jgi:putative phosphoesterase
MTQSRDTAYRIGVISDTHNRWKPLIAEIFADVDEIWHLGDICVPSTLDPLLAITSRLTVVLGNNDFGLDYPLERKLTRRGETFRLIHIPPRAWPMDCDWVLFGHTHVPCNEKIGSIHLFNPGSAGLANKGAPLSVGLLTAEPGQKFRGQIVLI